MRKNIKFFISYLLLQLIIYFVANLIYECKASIDYLKSDPVCLQLKDGKIIRGFIKDSNKYVLNVYEYDFKKLLRYDKDAKFILKSRQVVIGKLRKIDNDKIVITRADDICEEFERNDLVEINAMNDHSILTQLQIRKKNVKSCELLKDKSYYYSFAPWINSGDQVSVLLRDYTQKEGVIKLLTKSEIILELKNSMDTHIKWQDIKKIIFIRIAYHENAKKNTKRIVIALSVFLVIIYALNSIDLDGMGH